MPNAISRISKCSFFYLIIEQSIEVETKLSKGKRDCNSKDTGKSLRNGPNSDFGLSIFFPLFLLSMHLCYFDSGTKIRFSFGFSNNIIYNMLLLYLPVFPDKVSM